MEDIGAVLLYCLPVPVGEEVRGDTAGAGSLLSVWSGYWMVVNLKVSSTLSPISTLKTEHLCKYWQGAPVLRHLHLHGLLDGPHDTVSNSIQEKRAGRRLWLSPDLLSTLTHQYFCFIILVSMSQWVCGEENWMEEHQRHMAIAKRSQSILCTRYTTVFTEFNLSQESRRCPRCFKFSSSYVVIVEIILTRQRCVTFVYAAEHFSNCVKVCCFCLCCICLTM